MITVLIASLIANASPSPPANTGAPCQARCLAGISIGDDASVVLKRLGSQPLAFSQNRIAGDFNSYPDGLMLTVYYYKNVVAQRGAPTSTLGNVLRYGPTDGIHWDYTVTSGAITTILVSSVPAVQ